MKSWTRFALVAASFAASAAMAAETGIAALDAAWVKAFKAGDVEACTKLYAPDAVAWFPNSPEAKGTEAIRATYKGFLDGNVVKEVALSDQVYRKMGDTEAGWGHFKMTLAPKAGGQAQTMTGRYLALAQKRDGKWVYTADHASADPEPAPAPAAAPKAAPVKK